MFKGRSTGLGRRRGGSSTHQIVPLKGLFTDGIWHCNCAPRVPAQRFQTKNGGKNHGRWFYTCSKAQPVRCDFFLWDDDAKPREAAAVLSNSRTEPIPAPRTPTKPVNEVASYGLRTPYTDTSKVHRIPEPNPPYRLSKPSTVPQDGHDTQNTGTTLATSDEEFYDWPASDDDDVFKVADQATSQIRMTPPETPTKVAKTGALTSPGKRRFSEVEKGDTKPLSTPSNTDGDIFVTPSTGLKGSSIFRSSQALPSPSDTPTPRRFKDVLQEGHNSELTSEVFRILQDSKIIINPDVRVALRTVCDRHALSTQGFLKGRDILRTVVSEKNAKISELQETVATLQGERETNRAVIRHLRRDADLAKNSG